jgi:predicted phosphodiesterase
MSKVLIIGDTHFPACHSKYLEFVHKIYHKYSCNSVVHIGDVVDHHAISFHKKHPDAQDATSEYKKSVLDIAKWYQVFPKLRVCIGNHDERVYRLNADVGIPSFYIKGYNEVYGTKGWHWDYSFIIDGVYYTHGTGSGGLNPSFNQAKSRAISCVMGHHHSIAGINWLVGPTTRYFGMDVGCGVNNNHLGFSYGKNHLKKPVVSCGVVIDGKHPYLEVMDL